MSREQWSLLWSKFTSWKNIAASFVIFVSTVILFLYFFMYGQKDFIAMFVAWGSFVGGVLGVSYTANVTQKKVTQDVQSTKVPAVPRPSGGVPQGK